jgi:hypothetical protein
MQNKFPEGDPQTTLDKLLDFEGAFPIKVSSEKLKRDPNMMRQWLTRTFFIDNDYYDVLLFGPEIIPE